MKQSEKIAALEAQIATLQGQVQALESQVKSLSNNRRVHREPDPAAEIAKRLALRVKAVVIQNKDGTLGFTNRKNGKVHRATPQDWEAWLSKQ